MCSAAYRCTLVCRYAENQDLVNKNSTVIKEQASVIASLEERLNPQSGTLNSKTVKIDKKRIKTLEADLESLKVMLYACCLAEACRILLLLLVS